MTDRQRLEALEFQSIVDRMLPEHALKRRREESASAEAAGGDFLSPDWSGLALHIVMTVREAVALSCGISRRHAWVTEHRVGVGAALTAIQKARERMAYLEHGYGKPPDVKIPLEFLVDHAQRLAWDLPEGFPGVAARAGAQESAVKPMPRSRAQDAAILLAIKSAGYDPKALPKRSAAGKEWVKSEIRIKVAGVDPLFPRDSKVFDKACERLRDKKEIAEKA